MTFNLKEHKDKLLFLPLGGSGEIGMNFNLYYYNGKWLVIDCGAGFAEDYLPGVDLVLPDISYIVHHRNDIVGLVLTHAHEDHVGAVQYLWDALGCPIYTTTFTANFLKEKMEEANFPAPNKIHQLKPLSKIELGPFKIEMVPLCHSAPEMQALFIQTGSGNIFHTGDWKFDDNPVVGEANNETLLRSYGNRGIDVLVGDSTNVFNEDFSGSESDLRNSLHELISPHRKMLVVTTFASNLARLVSLMEIAQKVGRRIVLCGRSLHRIVKAAKASGYLKDIPALLDEKDISKYDRGSLFVIATGCQGEPLAAATKMSANNHPRIKLSAGDAVIFSSKIIPGNDKKIFAMFNRFAKMGVEVLTERDHFVHVSGHPSKKEIKKLYDWLKPKAVIPVHGEHVHMHEHAKIARSIGIKNTIEIENGDVVSIKKGGDLLKIAKVESGKIAVYGNYLLKTDSSIFRERRALREDGALVVTLVLSRKYKPQAEVGLIAPGYLDENEDKDLIFAIKEQISLYLHHNGVSANKKQDEALTEIKKQTKSLVKSILNQEIGRVPVIKIMISLI
jgi:ribonuclease J